MSSSGEVSLEMLKLTAIKATFASAGNADEGLTETLVEEGSRRMNKSIRIPLKNNLFALIDAEDAALVSGWKWRATRNSTRVWYVRGTRYVDGVRENKYLHRIILSPAADKVVDHINGDGLDCRRANMRVCTRQQNSFNLNKRPGTKHPYVGVYQTPNRSGWHAQIRQSGRHFYLGYFPTPEEAARAYDRKALELRGEFARLNFPAEAA